jgi:iron complex outermembrane receptor protein
MKRTFLLYAILVLWLFSLVRHATANRFSVSLPVFFQYNELGYLTNPDSLVSSKGFQDSVLLREIEITAPGKTNLVALRITRPDSVAMVAGLTADLSELLSRNTPVYIKHYGPGSMATASFRGTAASHTQVIWNGMKLNSPALGYTDLSLLPLFFTDEVYLLHGGSSLAKSSGALGA